jgi:hypothetical protein
MTCNHDWELLDYRTHTVRIPYQPLQAKFTYDRCNGCGARRLEAEDAPTYLITDETITPYVETFIKDAAK